MQATNAQKVFIKDFFAEFAELHKKYYQPEDNDEYWDNLTEESMKLVEDFSSENDFQNKLISDMVMLFLKSREEML